MVTPRGELVIDSSDGEHVLARYTPILLACFTRPPRSTELERVRMLAAEALGAGVRGGLLYVIARKDMKGGVDPSVRATFEAMTRKNASRAGASAVVVLTPGLGAAVARGVLAGLTLLMPQRGLLRVFPALEPACAWLAAQHALDEAALVDACRRATAHLPLPPMRDDV